MSAINTLTRSLNKGLFFLKKNSDTIEMVAGTACVAVGTGVLIHDAPKIAEVHNEFEERCKYIAESDEGNDWESKEERKKYYDETIKVITKGYIKVTWKGVALIAAGEVLQGISHATLSKKYQAVNTALAGTTLAFSQYRDRVVKDQGKEKDYEYLTGGTMVAVEEKADGTVTTTEVPLHTMDDASRAYIPHSFFLGDVNGFYLTSGNNGNVKRGVDELMVNLHYLNMELETKGYLFENTARERFAVKKTVAGQAAGLFYLNNDKSTNRLTLVSHGTEIGDPTILDGKPDDILFEIMIASDKPDGSKTLSPLKDNILNDIVDVDAITAEPRFGWLKC